MDIKDLVLKKWIMAYHWKKQGGNTKPKTLSKRILYLWSKWWKDDISEDNGVKLILSSNCNIMNCPKGENQSINEQYTQFFKEVYEDIMEKKKLPFEKIKQEIMDYYEKNEYDKTTINKAVKRIITDANSVNSLREKQWIMLDYLSTHDIDKIAIFNTWNNWWKGDFTDIKDDGFEHTYAWLCMKRKSTKPQKIHKMRVEIAQKAVTREIKQAAQKMGLKIQLHKIDKNNYKLAKYRIVDAKTLETVAGKNFKFTINDVEKYIYQRIGKGNK